MLTELCQEIHNWFDLNRKTGTFTISAGALTADFLANGQYYRIIGSVFNDGVHKFGDNTDTLTDEVFTGQVWALGIPKAVVDLAAQIDAWVEKYNTTDSPAMSPFTAESFGGYSYSKGNNLSTVTQANNPSSWKAVFASNLNRWRKI